MKLKMIFVIIALNLQLVINAQHRIKFESNNQIGLLSGSSGNDLQLQTINGLSYKTFFAGVGVGLDNYYFKTVPLFADVKKNLFEKKQTPFVYIDAGTNFPWEKGGSTTWQTTTYRAGLYYDFGVGYKWTIVKHICMNASFGFSEKRYTRREEYHSVGPDPLVYPNKYYYYLQRFTMKFGLSF